MTKPVGTQIAKKKYIVCKQWIGIWQSRLFTKFVSLNIFKTLKIKAFFKLPKVHQIINSNYLDMKVANNGTIVA